MVEEVAEVQSAQTEARWQHYFRSPPTKLGFGSLVYRAREHRRDGATRTRSNAALEEEVEGLIALMLQSATSRTTRGRREQLAAQPTTASGILGTRRRYRASTCPCCRRWCARQRKSARSQRCRRRRLCYRLSGRAYGLRRCAVADHAEAVRYRLVCALCCGAPDSAPRR